MGPQKSLLSWVTRSPEYGRRCGVSATRGGKTRQRCGTDGGSFGGAWDPAPGGSVSTGTLEGWLREQPGAWVPPVIPGPSPFILQSTPTRTQM